MTGRLNIIKILIAIATLIAFGSCDKLPNGVEVQDIPSYYFENNYLDGRVDAINQAIAECSGDCETFFWITDIHWEPDLNLRKSPLLIKYIALKTGIDKILNGGDTGNSQVMCRNAISQLKAAIGSDKVYSVTGNHEINDASRYESPYQRVADELRGHCKDIVYGDDNKSYFYFDNPQAKTRYVGLSTYGLFMDKKYESAYTPQQLEWFRNTALNVGDGWSIVVFTHSLYSINEGPDILITGPLGSSDFINAIDNYDGKGSICCVLIGHTHRDRLHIGTTGVPYIISSCDRQEAYNGDINVDRIPGSVTEQHFEVVVIDRKNRQVKLFAIGGKARDGYDNDLGDVVDVRVVNY